MLLRRGSEGEQVAELQQALESMGLYDIGVDGDFGKGTERAVEEYQEQNKLVPDGIAGKLTLSAMGFDWAEYEEGDDIEQEAEVEDFEIDTDDESIVGIINSVTPLFSASVTDRVEESLAMGLSLVAPYMADLQLDTPIKLALFFGQIRQEVGAKWHTVENLNYRCTALPKLFKVYRSNGLANKHGRCDGHKANQMEIANHAYANRIGNGDADSGDGGLFRGAGCKQLTGRANYLGYHNWLQENLPEVYEQTNGEAIMEQGADAVKESPHDLLSAIYFWHANGLYKGAERGFSRGASDYVTKIVNRHTDSYAARWKHTCSVGQCMGIV